MRLDIFGVVGGCSGFFWLLIVEVAEGASALDWSDVLADGLAGFASFTSPPRLILRWKLPR